MSAEYRVKVGIRNNLILSAIAEMGFRSVSAFCRQYGLGETSVNNMICFRRQPISPEGSFRKEAKDLMEALGCAPGDLWTDAQLSLCLKRNNSERVVDECDVQSLIEDSLERMTLPDPADILERLQEQDRIESTLDENLSKREAKVIRLRFGIGSVCDHTLEEVGSKYDLTGTRIRQIEMTAIRKLKNTVAGKKEVTTA